MAAAKMTLRLRKKSALDKSSEVLSAEASPDSKCPICLDRFNNMAYLDLCLHKFCFRCIHEWSKNKAECPLCKQPFNSIYHSIQSEKDFKKYDLRPTENGSFGSFAGERFRYRTTLTGARRQDQRRTSPPPDNGVMFEALTGASPPPRQDRGLRRMMARLAARRRAESEGRTVRSLREQEMIKFRRALYRRGVRVRSVRDGGRSRDISAEFFQKNPACLHRLLPWLKRELVVLYGAHGSLVNIVQHIIMSRITRYDMEDRAIHEELQPFLQARTDHFLHEFVNFARAPFNMEAYDQHAVYDCPAPSSDEGSSSNSSVIAISEDEEEGDSVELDPPGDPMSGGALSQSTWDDETPGPSYSTTEPTRALLLSIRDSDSESSVGEECGAVLQPKAPRLTADSAWVKTDKEGQACTSSGDEDCIIVGFVKPLAERTPELVKLSSDSEESVLEEIKDEVPRLLQHIRFTSLSPASSQGQCPGKAEGVERKQDVSCSKERRNTSPSIRCETSSSKSASKNRGQTEKDGRRCHSRDRSRERPRSRSRDRGRRSRSADRSRSTKSPAISINSDSTLSRGRRQSRSQSRDRSHTKWEKTRDNKDSSRSGRSHDSSSHSYHWHYYSRESERDSSATLYTERRSYYSSSHRNIDCRSPSQSPDSHRRDKRRSRSRSSTCSLSGAHRKSRHEKPSGKRKYKSRHLEEPAPKDQSSKALDEPPSSTTSSYVKDKKKSKEKRHRKSKEKSGGKRSRSLSVEIIFEGSSSEQTRKHQKKKKKHKKKGKRHRSKDRTGSRKHSPTVITIDSDSDQHTAAGANDANHTCPVSSSTSNSVLAPSTTTTTGNPADSGLLESMLQDWEQQIPPVGLDSGVLEAKPPINVAAASDTPTHSEGVLSQSASADEANSHSPSNDNTSHFLEES
ncbi:E3 ubiquitin-protein ligase Topors [Oncorhynchus kisutch]|uniref:E3 ubiquitin-protein ligase Topors n=1 Tax=Oncorhynchus kisutch TaxID=8019 RepID=A0A8C7KSD6_ONCKI|nr:E3 ubiquitin-protein ligase Topors [Oncorhynchus kisutch]